jgi:Domain of unknown function (DUF4091)
MNSYDNASGRRGAVRGTFPLVKGLRWAAAVLVVLTILVTGGQASGQAFPVWVSPRLVRVGLTDATGTTTSINVSSGRGETIATQVIVQAPSGGLTNVNVSASALNGPNGATIAASNITLYREFYVTVNGTTNYGGGSNPPQGSGTYAEPLIPFNDPQSGSPLCGNGAALQACNASVVAGQNQPYWIDIFVPRGSTNSPPGAYTGNISVSADQGNATIPVTLTVWNFELPLRPSEASLWSTWAPALGTSDADINNLAKALMRNKLMYWSDVPGVDDVPGHAAYDIATFGLIRSGLEYYNFFAIPCSESNPMPPGSIPSASKISTWAATYPAGLPVDIYVLDEWNEGAMCTSAASQDVMTTANNAHTANPSVKTIMTAYAPDPTLSGYIDHWVLLDSHQSWPTLPWNGPGDLSSYTSCNTGAGNTPEWMTDYPPVNERIQAGFLNWAEGATGILYYRVDGWNAGNTVASWNNLNVTACLGNSRPGDGMFLYPPAPIGSSEEAPGIRLKAIRDGVQDYEYAHLLHTLGQDAFVNSTLQWNGGSWSWTNWPTPINDPNGDVVENARLQMGQKLNQLGPP